MEVNVLWRTVLMILFDAVTESGIELTGADNNQKTAAWTLGYQGYRLEGSVLSSVNVPSSTECGQRCLADPRCKSANYQSTSSTIQGVPCELNNSTKLENREKFTRHPSFTHYQLQRQVFSQQVKTTRAVYPSTPRNCPAFLHGQHSSGNYTIYDDNGNSFTVWCYLDHNQGKAWTLVLSFSYPNYEEAGIKTASLTKDLPVNDAAPNLSRYRMSKTRMAYIRSQSTSWTSICNFKGVISDKRDTVRGRFSNLDPTTFLHRGVCRKVSYINIRGYVCTDCTAPWFQDTVNNIIHTDSGLVWGCQFDATKGSVHSEDNFGLYWARNNQFECTKDVTSTTSWWFGD